MGVQGSKVNQSTVGDYEFMYPQKILGVGCYGSVYQGRHKKYTSKMVAIKKVMLLEHDEKHGRCLRRESNVLTTLPCHPNIVRFFHEESHIDACFFVMEFCNGGTLQAFLSDVKRSDDVLCNETLKLFAHQLTAALYLLDKLAIIHRDLKPDNVLIKRPAGDSDPLRFVLKLADFGWSRKVIDEEACDAESFSSNSGNIYFRAPECNREYHPNEHFKYDTRANLWGLGLLFFCMIELKLPFTSLIERFQFCERLKSEDLTFSSSYVASLLPERVEKSLRKVIVKLLRLNCDERITMNGLNGERYFADGYFREWLDSTSLWSPEEQRQLSPMAPRRAQPLALPYHELTVRVHSATGWYSTHISV